MSTHETTSTTTRVVVLGAGYAGVMATNRFLGSLTDAERSEVQLTVVNPRDAFVERIRLHELAAGSRGSVSIPLPDMLHDDATLITGTAERIDHQARTVRVAAAGRELDLPYDYLVYAVGSRAATPIPGLREHAYLLADYDSAQEAAAVISAYGHGGKIAVIGGGFTAVEAASEVAEQHPDAEVTLYCASALLPGMRASARGTIAKVLRGQGVGIVENALVVQVDAGKLQLAGGEVHPFDLCLVAVSFDVPELAQLSGLPTDGRGRLEVDETLRCPADPRVIGAGDAIAAPDQVARHLRMSCAAALPLGAHAAATLLAAIRGSQPPVLSAGYVLQCISLGRKNGYIQVVKADDTPRSLHVGGRAAAAVKRRVCSMVVDSPVKETSKPGAYRWPKGPKSKAAAS